MKIKKFNQLNENSSYPNRKSEIETLGQNIATVIARDGLDDEMKKQVKDILHAASMDGALQILKYINEHPEVTQMTDTMMSGMDKDIQKILDHFYGDDFGFSK